MARLLIFSLLFSGILLSCNSLQEETKEVKETTDISAAPEWAQNVIWYQIFVERFHNGDPSNDPRIKDITGNGPEVPENWSVTPWDHDWYEREPWTESLEGDFYGKIQLRRYGGDLQGVLDKIDYIDELGVTAIYFNPLNDAPSLHKYDARNYRHIDRNFGPDPDGDEKLMNSEIQDDPTTWKWTSADSLFLHVVQKFHERGIRVILDYSWNHTGTEFWALKDLKENGEKSRFTDWYNVLSFDDPETPENEFDFEGWAGYKGLPVFSKIIIPEDDDHMPFEGNLASESLKEHIFNVSKRWLDPNGDGNPEDGIDGYRLDVAAEVPQDFWREYRKVIREVNPDAYLIGEVWWDVWPETLMEPSRFLKGDQFDAIMNYRWYRIARGFFAQAEPVLKPSEFISEIERIENNIDRDKLQAMMNMSSSHDAPRLSTSLYNKQMYKFQVKPNDDSAYKIDKPDETTLKEQKMFLMHQFTYPGSPQIWNGDEVGMWGADDPDCRKPMVWEELTYKDEVAHFFADSIREAQPVKVDKDLLQFYKELTALRRSYPLLATSDLEFIHHDDEKMTLGYERTMNDDVIIAVFNRSDSEQELNLDLRHNGIFYNAMDNTAKFTVENGKLNLSLNSLEGLILIKK